MDVTLLKNGDKFCGVYLENGILLDARPGIGQALKENGLQPRTVLLTAMAGQPALGLSELEGVPIGDVPEDCAVTQFPVGSKGDKRYGFRLKTPDGELVYAPEFDRLEKSKIAGADLAILDPGDRSETGDAAGLSHKSFTARQRMVINANVGQAVWTDNTDETVWGLPAYKKTAADLNDAERTALRNKSDGNTALYNKLVRMYIHALESYDSLDSKPEGVAKQQYAMGAVNNFLKKKEADETEDIDKARSPNSDFLVIEPGHDGSMDKQHLRVKHNGNPDHGLMGAAHAALLSAGGHRGNPYQGPDKAKAVRKLRALYRSESIDWPADKKTKAVDLTQRLEDIRESFRQQFAGFYQGSSYVYISRIYDEYVICEYDSKTYQVDYDEEGGEFVFAGFQDWAEVETVISYQPVSKSQLVVTKEQDGKRKWMSVSSSDFRDVDGEVVSTAAMDFAIAVAKKRGQAGNLVWDHYDELPLGPCTSQTRVGRFLVESGDFLDSALATKAADKLESSPPGKYRVSIGFKYWKGTRSEDGTYHLIDIFHRAVTDHPANAATGIEVTKSMKTLTPEVIQTIGKDLGMTEDEIKELAEKALKPEAKAKEADNPDVKTALKEGEAEKPKTETPEPTLADVVKLVKELQDQFKTLKEQTATEVKDKLLAVLKDAPAGDVIKPSTKAAELTPDEQAKLEAFYKQKQAETGFGSVYQMFQSSPAK